MPSLPALAAAAALALAAPAAAAPPAPADPYAAALSAADAAWAGRDDPARLAEAAARYAEAAALKPGEVGPRLALARAQALRAQADPAVAREAWAAAARAAEEALRRAAPAFDQALAKGEPPARAAALVEAPAAEPLYWLALATMGLGQSRGLAAMLAVRGPARALMERAAALDEQLDHGGPRRALGAWLAALPSAAGGGAAAARRELDRARELAPEYQLTRVRDAETLQVLVQDRARFQAELQEVLAFDPARAPAIAPENRLAQRLARALLARMDQLF